MAGMTPVCVFGEPTIGPHPLCEAEAERLCAAFDADVITGTYDAEGYTPRERAAIDRTTKTRPV
jgi:hypothetical protein